MYPNTSKSGYPRLFSIISVWLTFIIVCSLIAVLFTPAVAAPLAEYSPPTPISPTGGQVYTSITESGTLIAPPVAIPAFSWNGVMGATKYRLQVSQDISFSTKVEVTTPLTRWTPNQASQFNDGQWYWRVKVDQPSPGSAYSTTQTFSRQWASANNKPVLSSPSNHSVLEFLDSATFQWSPVVGAAKYRFQISSNSIFTSLVYNQLTLATIHQPVNKLAEGVYYWRVIPIDPANREGTPSEVWDFTQQYNQVPILIEPANASFPTFTPTFHWTAVRGAEYYQLQYSTDPSFNTNVSQTNTRNTQFTPIATLPNDVNYYWRVRTISGNSQSNWSSVWSFQKRWYLQPTLLTPTNLYQQARFPFFSWSPVPGAATYKIEYNTAPSFPPGPDGESATTANPFYSFQKYKGSYDYRYWRVTPIDANKHEGKPSAVSSYLSFQDHNAPVLIYPLYYYPPDSSLNPHEDRSVSQPIFQWHKLLDINGNVSAPAYRVEVSTSPIFIPGTIVWSVDTENLAATPTVANNFTPDPGLAYYWRVCPLGGLGGSCLQNPSAVDWWSQPWKTRIDTSLMPAPTSGSAPELLRPRDLYEYAETTPLLEWLPYQGANFYEVQISRYSDFSVILDSNTVDYPAYASTDSIAQTSLAKYNFGPYYWRVRAHVGSSFGNWSQTRRFLVAAHSQWQESRTIGTPSNRLQIATDAAGEVPANYDLSSLFAAQDKDYWYFGFNAYTSTVDMKYVVYFDLDHEDNSGATSDAEGYTVSTTSTFRPEYAIYTYQIGAGFSANAVALYQWNNNTWTPLGSLAATGGDLYYESSSNYIELKVANTAIGMGPETGSYALALFSVPFASGNPQDSVPASPGTTVLTHFASVTERLNAVQPADHTPNDTQIFSSVPPIFWDYGENTPFTGVNVKVYLDDQFTNEVGDFTLTSNAYYYSDNARPWPTDLAGDNTYYWRVRPRYLLPPNNQYGAWSPGNSFVRTGLVPTNLQESVTFATPTFSWDMVEGASGYDLQVDNDPNFGSTVFSIVTSQNQYTWTSTLPNDIYYWRVRMKRDGSVTNEWSPPKMFTLSYPTPTGLTPDDPSAQAVVGRAPTMCWTPLIVSQNSVPTLAAYKYRLQVSFGDPTFSSTYEKVDTEQSCYTPTKGYNDGKYYWRVAMIDGNGNQGAYSSAAEFTKQYSISTLLSPTSGDSISTTPTFQWTVVNGAASYRLEISKFPTFSPLFDSITTNLVEFTPRKIYDINQTYYWRVAIIDADSKYGPFNNEIVILDPLSGKNKIFLPFLKK